MIGRILLAIGTLIVLGDVCSSCAAGHGLFGEAVSVSNVFDAQRWVTK